MAGPQRKSRVMTETERRIIAYHESGHALVGHVLENSDPVHKISIISRGQALGYTMQLPAEDHFLKSRREMLDDTSAVVMTASTAVKSSPDKSSTDLFVLHEGTVVTITNRLDDWCEVVIADGKKGWLECRKIETI